MNAEWWSYFAILITTISFIVYKYVTRNFDYWKKRNVPYIKPIPFLGNISTVLLMKITSGEWLWKSYNEMSGSCFGMFLFDQPVLVLKSPKLIKAVLQKDFDYFDDRTAATNMDDPVTDNLIFFKKNPLWKPIRAKVSPVFTSGKLKLMFPLILNEGKEMAEYLKKFANVPNVEAKEITAKYSTNVIARCAFAVDAQSFKNEDAEFRNISRAMFDFRIDTALRQFGSFFTPSLIKIFKIHFFSPKLMNSMKSIFSDVLQSRKAATNLRGNDLVDILIEANRKDGDNLFSDDAILGHAIQFFAAGFETVSSTISFSLYELAINPEVQDKLRAEILEYTKTDGITYDTIREMKYLDMVVSESLRKYPVVPFLDRMCKSDYKVEGSDLVIEKGTRVYIPVFGLHYDPKYFQDPYKYDPERFADKTKINKDGMYYVPFGEGPRICIGERFGLVGVKIGLVSILSKYKVEKSDQTPIPLKFEPKGIILQSTVGVPVKFVPL